MRLSVFFVGVFAVALLHCVHAQTTGVQVAPPDQTAVVGDSAEIQCKADVSGGDKVTWTKGNLDGSSPESPETITPLTPGFEIFTPNDTNGIASVLRILEVSPANEGRYTCQYESNGATSRATSTLKVTYEGLVQITGDRVLQSEKDSNFTCLVNGLDTFNVTWKKNDTFSLPDSKISSVEIKGSLLIIKHANVDRDHGNYTCSSTFNGVPVSARITVGGTLRLKAPKAVKFTEGERARFECIAKFPLSDPLPTFTWYLGNETIISDINEGGRFEIKPSQWVNGSVLHMKDVVFDDAGNYTCVAKSDVTTVEHTILLRVRDRLAALWPFIGIMSEVILLIIIIFIHEKCTQGDDIGEEDEEDEVAEPVKEKEKISLDGEGDMRMRTSKP